MSSVSCQLDHSHIKAGRDVTLNNISLILAPDLDAFFDLENPMHDDPTPWFPSNLKRRGRSTVRRFGEFNVSRIHQQKNDSRGKMAKYQARSLSADTPTASGARSHLSSVISPSQSVSHSSFPRATAYGSDDPHEEEQAGSNSDIIEGRIIRMNDQRFTAAPPNGFWPPQTTRCPWTNVSAKTRADWKTVEGPKAFVRLYGAKYHSKRRMARLAGKIAFVIKRLIDEPGVVVKPPVPEQNGRDRLGAPWSFLLSGISSQSLNVLTSQCMWSTSSASFFVLPFDAPLPTYILSLKNMPYANCESVSQCVKGKLRTIKEASGFLAERLGGNLAAATTMVDSIFVRSLEVNQELVFSVHCRPAAGLALDHYLEWVGYVQSLEYETFYGRLIPCLDFCAGCKASDHPTSLCPLPLTPGWLGPSSDAFLSKDRPRRPRRRFQVGGSSRVDVARKQGNGGPRRGTSLRRGASFSP